MKPFFTVVIPTYNRSEEVQRSINCVLNQTFKNWELIVVDDGSSDDTSLVLEQYIQSEPRIHYCHRPAERLKGANACRNIGIEKALGEYIALLDSDDEWEENRLLLAYDFIKESNCNALYSGCLVDDGEQRIKYKSREFNLGENHIDFLFAEDTFAPTPSLIVRSEYAKKVKFDEDMLCHQDMDFFIRYGQQFGWKYFDNYDVIVNWKKGRVASKPHFPSMIAYYNKIKEQITNKRVFSGYLLHCWINAKKNDPQFCPIYRDFLREIFAHLTFKQKLFAIAPNLSFYIWDKVLNTEGHWRSNN